MIIPAFFFKQKPEPPKTVRLYGVVRRWDKEQAVFYWMVTSEKSIYADDEYQACPGEHGFEWRRWGRSIPENEADFDARSAVERHLHQMDRDVSQAKANLVGAQRDLEQARELFASLDY